MYGLSEGVFGLWCSVMFIDTVTDEESDGGDTSDNENDASEQQPQISLHAPTVQGCVYSVVISSEMLTSQWLK